jgi:lipopolysaccharide transport system ATP-binding protein
MAEDEALVSVNSVSKKFCKDLSKSLRYGLTDMTNALLGKHSSNQLRRDEFWALRDISFKVNRGECLGLIGHNGAGKSTLLKILNGISHPDKGEILVKGKVGAIIELGVGFNPLLSGRENIYTNASILGFKHKDIKRKFDSIVAFSELEDFIDMPVQNYSTGMKVRLGFAVTSQMEPDVLLIDEVLAVGDAGFRSKCLNEIQRMMKHAAVIFVSHSMNNILKICSSGILLEHGSVKLHTSDVHLLAASYLKEFSTAEVSIEGLGLAELKSLTVIEGEKESVFQIPSNTTQDINVSHKQQITLTLKGLINKNIEKFIILYVITDMEQKLISQASSEAFINTGIASFETNIPALLLNTGSYYLSFEIYEIPENRDRGNLIYGMRNFLKMIIARSKFIGVAPIIYNT